MTAPKVRRGVGIALIFTPLWAIVAVGLITDTRDAAIGFGILFGILAVMALGAWLMGDPS